MSTLQDDWEDDDSDATIEGPSKVLQFFAALLLCFALACVLGGFAMLAHGCESVKPPPSMERKAVARVLTPYEREIVSEGRRRLSERLKETREREKVLRVVEEVGP